MASSGGFSGFWGRHRLKLILVAVLGWAVFISTMYRSTRQKSNPASGAAELLQIGALPVT